MANDQSENDDEKKVQLSLRISESAKERLNAHCAWRQASEKKPISYNQAILDLIEAAPRSKPKRKRTAGATA